MNTNNTEAFNTTIPKKAPAHRCKLFRQQDRQKKVSGQQYRTYLHCQHCRYVPLPHVTKIFQKGSYCCFRYSVHLKLYKSSPKI